MRKQNKFKKIMWKVNKVLAFWLSVILLTNLDQWTKLYFAQGGSFNIGNFIEFNLALNHGSAFSLPIPAWLTGYIGLAIALIGLGAPIWFEIKKIKLHAIAWILATILTAGVIGNTIDRLAYGVVVDFIDLGWWPIFNIADIYLCIGLVILLIATLFNKQLYGAKH